MNPLKEFDEVFDAELNLLHIILAELNLLQIILCSIAMILVEGWWDYLLVGAIALSIWDMVKCVRKIENKKDFIS